MADKTILDLTSATPALADSLEFQVAAGGAGSSKRTTVTNLRTTIANGITLVAPNLGTPASGNLLNCTGFPAGGLTGLATGVGTWLGTPSSANLAAAVTDETGTGSLVFSNSPVLVTPNLGVPSAIDLSNGLMLSLQGRIVSGTTDTIVATDRGAEVIYTTGSSCAVTLGNAVSFFGDGFSFWAKNAGTGTVTIVPTTTTIDGASSFVLPAGMSGLIISKGGAYYVNYGKQGSSGGSGTVTNTGTLTANRLIIGNGGVDVTALSSLGTTTTVLHGNASGAPTFGAVSLTADVTGNLPVGNLNGGTSASATTFWAGDATWKAPFTLTTTGTSGAATFTSGTLNIPQYTGGGGSTIPGVVIGCEPGWVSSTQISINGGQLYIEGTNSIIAVVPQTLTPSSPTANTWYHGYVNNAGTFSIATTLPAAFATPIGTAKSKTGDTNNRYIGSFKTDGSGNWWRFDYSSISGMYRWHGQDLGASPFRCLGGGSATISTSVDLSGAAALTAITVYLFLQVINAGGILYIGKGGVTLDSTHFAFDTSFTVGEGTIALVPYGNTQTVNYFVSSGSMQAYIDVFGFILAR